MATKKQTTALTLASIFTVSLPDGLTAVATHPGEYKHVTGKDGIRTKVARTAEEKAVVTGFRVAPEGIATAGSVRDWIKSHPASASLSSDEIREKVNEWLRGDKARVVSEMNVLLMAQAVKSGTHRLPSVWISAKTGAVSARMTRIAANIDPAAAAKPATTGAKAPDADLAALFSK